MKVSILLLTIDRYETTKRCLDMALENAHFPYELLVTDNGSQDQRVIDYVKTKEPALHIVNGENKGIAPSHNQMLWHATGDYFVLIGNDIELPPGWLSKLVITYEKTNNFGYKPGLAGIHCVETLHRPHRMIDGTIIHPGHNVFGTMFFSRKVLDGIGYFNEIYHPYGMDDSDYAYRLIQTGHTNFYLHGMSSTHVENDVGQQTDYRKMKDQSLQKNLEKFNQAIKQYDESGDYYIPFHQEPYTIFEQQFQTY